MSWETSSYCRESNCVEVSIGPFDVVVRNSSHRMGEFVSFNHDEWRDHLLAVENGEHRLPGDTGVTRAELHREIARLYVEVEKLRAALRHPSSHKARVSAALSHVQAEHGEVLRRLGES